MKTIKELQDLADATNDNWLELMHDEFHNHENPAMRIFHDVLVDWSNECYDTNDNYDSIEERDNILMSMCDGEYEPNSIFIEFLVDSIKDGKPNYVPTQEHEMNEMLDIYNFRVKSMKEFRDNMFQKHGVIWDNLTDGDKMEIMIKDVQENPPAPQDNLEEPINRDDFMEDDGEDYQDLPF